MSTNFCMPGKADFIIGGQWGSEGKGASAAVLADGLAKHGRYYDIYTTNAGAQAGHTSVHKGKKRVVFHLPTAALVAAQASGGAHQPLVYLNAGSIIDPDVLRQELNDNADVLHISRVRIHPNAAVIEQQDRDAEGANDSAQTKIASTRKGVGHALARKVLRSASLAKDHPWLRDLCGSVDLNLDLQRGLSVLVEVPQGIGLSLNGEFYPHCTSRDCSVMQAMNDAAVHPAFYGCAMLALRTFPIRVGNIGDNSSGGCYGDQYETTWEAIGREPEITTVTKRVRRIFTFSEGQMLHAMRMTRPSLVHLTFCDYTVKDHVERLAAQITNAAKILHLPAPAIIYQYGPSTDDSYIFPQED